MFGHLWFFFFGDESAAVFPTPMDDTDVTADAPMAYDVEVVE